MVFLTLASCYKYSYEEYKEPIWSDLGLYLNAGDGNKKSRQNRDFLIRSF